MVNENTVDLSPLFKWWSKQEGDRPLSAWAHLSGKVIGTNAFCWIVEGKAEPTRRLHVESDKKFLLKNPPLQDRAQFEALAARFKSLESEHNQLKSRQMQAKDREAALRAQHKNRRHTRAEVIEGRQARQAQASTNSKLKKVDQQLAELKKQIANYPAPDHYVVDCFALETDQKENGMAVYDHGITVH